MQQEQVCGLVDHQILMRIVASHPAQVPSAKAHTNVRSNLRNASGRIVSEGGTKNPRWQQGRAEAGIQE